MQSEFVLRPIGAVQSSLRDPSAAPRQADEGAPTASILLDPGVLAAAADISAGDDLLVLTWLHLAGRAVLAVHPRGDESRPLSGVFSTRSQDRPNPIGLHRVRVLAVRPGVIDVDAIEAVDGTPVLDLKPVIGGAEER